MQLDVRGGAVEYADPRIDIGTVKIYTDALKRPDSSRGVVHNAPLNAKWRT